MDKNLLDKFKQHKWYVTDMITRFDKGKLIHSRTTPNKNVWIYECTEKKTQQEYIMKTIKRKLEKNVVDSLCKQLFDMYHLYEKMQHKTNLGNIAGFDVTQEGDEFYVRIIMEKCKGTLKTFISLNNRMKPEQYIEQFKSIALTLFELEGRNMSHKNLTINSIYYIFNKEGKMEFKIFGFSNFIWGGNDGSMSYISPEEKYLMNTFEGSALSTPYDMDYFKVDSFNLGVTFLELIFMKEIDKWGFSLEEKKDPKMLEVYQHQEKINHLLHQNLGYLKGYEFIYSILKNMIHVNPRKRDRFTKILYALHEFLNLKIFTFSVNPEAQTWKPMNFSKVQEDKRIELDNIHQGYKSQIKILEDSLKKQSQMIIQQQKQIEMMSNQVNMMQSNIRQHTDNKIINEFKIIKRLDEGNNSPVDKKPKKLRTMQEKVKLQKMDKYDKETTRELKMTLGPILSAMKHFKPNAINRAYLLTWMATNATYFKYLNMFKTAIKDASDAKNSDAIFIIISVLFKNKIDTQKIFEMMVQDNSLKNHFVRYLRQFKPNLLKTFSDYFCLSDLESGYILYRKAFANDNKECQLEFVKLAKQLAAQNRTEKNEEIVTETLTEQIQYMETYNVDVLETVNERLESFYEKNLAEKANKYIQEQKYSPKMAVIKQFRSLVRIKEFEKADAFIENNNISGYDSQQKKNIYHLDVELIADQFYKAQQFDKAWKYIEKMEDVATACDRLVGLDQTERAIQHATLNKNVDGLQIILQKTRDAETKERVSQLILVVGKEVDEQKKIKLLNWK